MMNHMKTLLIDDIKTAHTNMVLQDVHHHRVAICIGVYYYRIYVWCRPVFCHFKKEEHNCTGNYIKNEKREKKKNIVMKFVLIIIFGIILPACAVVMLLVVSCRSYHEYMDDIFGAQYSKRSFIKRETKTKIVLDTSNNKKQEFQHER